MVRITRSTLQAAIEAGLESADFPAEEAEALRRVGREATRIGTNFESETGCPYVLAGLYGRPVGERPALRARLLDSKPNMWAFVEAYDRALGCQPSPADVFEVIEG